MSNDPNFRPACRRCQSTGKVKGQTYASGVCFDCGGKGHGPSLNDQINTARKSLQACADYGKRLAADRFTKANVLQATRDEYVRIRTELRALKAKRALEGRS